MIPFEELEPQRMAFLYELYKRSEGDPRRSVPYEALVDALGFSERVTKCIQRELQQEGLAELTAVPQMTNVGRTVIDPAHRRSRRQAIGITPHGVRLIEDILSCSHGTCETSHGSIFVAQPMTFGCSDPVMRP